MRRTSVFVAMMFCLVMAAMFLGGYLWRPLSLACAAMFLLLGLFVGLIPDRDEEKIGGTDC